MTNRDTNLNYLIDDIVNELKKPSAERLNALHACRPNHPLNGGSKPTKVIYTQSSIDVIEAVKV